MQLYVSALAECTTVNNAVGCASADTVGEALAEACGTAVASAFASSTISEDCDCDSSLNTDALLTAELRTELFANVGAWVGAEACSSGDMTAKSDVYLTCSASAYAALTSHVRFRPRLSFSYCQSSRSVPVVNLTRLFESCSSFHAMFVS
jgi:hypothetical protein